MTTAQASLRTVVVAGVGMTAFGKFLDRSIKSLVAESVQAAIKDSEMGDSDKGIDTIYYANTASGILQGQHSVRGQHAMREAGLNGIPLINIENACASGSTALNQAWLAVASGYVDVALAVGAEKLYHPDKQLTFAAMGSALDQDRLAEIFADIGARRRGPIGLHGCLRESSHRLHGPHRRHPGRLRSRCGQEPRPRCA